MEFKNKHSLGQNFLDNSLIINKIVDSVKVLENDIVIEVGPGLGYLTSELKKYNVKLLAFEIDERTKPYLNKLVDDKTTVIYKDFMSVDLNDYVDKDTSIHIIANIPYYITTPIIEHIINMNLNVVDMTLMVQEEVANRLSSGPGNKEYGYITAYLNYYFKINKLFSVNRNYFNPVPNVDSAVLQLNKGVRTNIVINETVLSNFIKEAFQFKRKNLRNNLKKYDLNIISEVLKNYNFDLNSRAEELSIDIFIEIVNKITD